VGEPPAPRVGRERRRAARPAGLADRSIARAELLDVEARQTGHVGYGLQVRLSDAEPLELADTARRWSRAEAQAAALRRWAGLPPVS
jgi:hypothetical protein